ncbi:MAG: hypothetical protein U0Z44_03560 [Kouleothrix sp.]
MGRLAAPLALALANAARCSRPNGCAAGWPRRSIGCRRPWAALAPAGVPALILDQLAQVLPSDHGALRWPRPTAW